MADPVASVDVANHDLFAAFRERGCPMCRVLIRSDSRATSSFVAEGHLNPGTRAAFLDAGRFCPHHAFALLEESELVGTGAVIAVLYGSVAEQDLYSLERTSESAPRRRREREKPPSLRSPGPCNLCQQLAAAERRQPHFMLTLLADAAAREHYRGSDGLCRPHLADVVGEAESSRKTAELAKWLLEDWRQRLLQLRHTLADYDRKRDYRLADQRKAVELSWRRIISLYAGEPAAWPRRPAAWRVASRPAPAAQDRV
jgi:hypothetical protein